MKWILFLFLSPVAAMADPIEGVWQTHPAKDGGYGLVRIAPCGTGFCGDVVGQFDASGREIVADRHRVIEQVVPKGATYGGGRVVNPETGRSYAARLILEGDRLDVGGCLLGICRSGGIWRRVD